MDNLDICEHCESQVEESELNEVKFRDADGDIQSLWLCTICEEDQVWV